MEQALTEGAAEHIESVDLSPIGRYLEGGFAPAALVEWALNKFGVAVPVEALPVNDIAAAEENLQAAVEAVYLRREIEYPCEYLLDITIGRAGADSAYALNAVCEWANRKYDAGWSPDQLTGKDPEAIRDDLVALAENFLADGRLAETVQGFLDGPGRNADADAVAQWARQRFDAQLPADQLADGDRRETLIRAGRGFLRRELTELERFVLLQIHDASWKDHLLAIDHLRGAVGLRGFAQQDPKIVYKKEGFKLFGEMLSSIRARVTDIIFRARMADAAEMQNVYQISSLVHDQMTAYDDLALDMAAQQAAAAPRKIETIIRDRPKVGRNAPCPCGSGKKYKKCCGRT
ncbi:hypothetical protein LCGC14_2485190 [marine sediment metagenome]|uniref:SecA Wing/Scaffold domain-containing protein n=1 Tax=marine sediment metagenome TaxID=412755 RepID=A0A0F9B756_9ZZZZ